MKIGRNDPCPCGSGKKYKRCCLNKPEESRISTSRNNLGTNNDMGHSFDYINEASEKISQVLSQYNIEDVSKAIYCINAWRPNRSALAQSYAANKALCLCKTFGNRRIVEYDDLISLFNEISVFSVMSMHDDYTIDDFGEVFLNYQGRTYPIITGTGFLMVYPCIRFIPYICDQLGRQEELVSILTYLEIVISSLCSSSLLHLKLA